MPKCTNCGRLWNLKETMKASFSLDPALICPYCGVKQYMTVKSRRRVARLNIIVLLTILLPAFTDWSLLSIAGIIIVAGAAGLSVMPHLMELTNEEEHLY